MGDKDFDNSDSDDSDFVVPQDELSDNSIQSDYDSEDSHESDNENGQDKKKKSTKKHKYKASKSRGSKRCLRSTNEDDEQSETEKDESLSTENEKERADSLWANFLNDTATPSKSKSSKMSTSTTAKSYETPTSTNKTEVPAKSSTDCSADQSDLSNCPKIENSKSPITTETIKDNTENTVSSIDDKVSTKDEKNKSTTKPNLPVLNKDIKRRGISSVLGSLNKKTKLSTLEKSKLDWNQFKEENNLKEEINTFNRGKNGYLERQDFLQRADSRQFEIEKQLRAGKRGSR